MIGWLKSHRKILRSWMWRQKVVNRIFADYHSAEVKAAKRMWDEKLGGWE